MSFAALLPVMLLGCGRAPLDTETGGGTGGAGAQDGSAIPDGSELGTGGQAGGGQAGTGGLGGGGGLGGMDGGPAPVDATSPEGAPPTDPGKVACGMSMSCDVATQTCCITGGGGGGIMASCIPLNSPCRGAELTCDERADCTANQYCCGSISMGGTAETRCTAEAMCRGQNQVIMCKSVADCPPSQSNCCTIGRMGFTISYCSQMPCRNPP